MLLYFSGIQRWKLDNGSMGARGMTKAYFRGIVTKILLLHYIRDALSGKLADGFEHGVERMGS